MATIPSRNLRRSEEANAVALHDIFHVGVGVRFRGHWPIEDLSFSLSFSFSLCSRERQKERQKERQREKQREKQRQREQPTFLSVYNGLQGIVQGYIVDAFSAIRGEEDARTADSEEKCYICSLSKFELQQAGIK